MARRIQRRFQNQRRPNRDWSAINETVFTTVAAATKVILASFVLKNPGIDETILRSVGSLAVASDQVATTEDYMGAFGMIIVTDTALAAGVVSIPGPVTDGDDDGWFTYVGFSQRFTFITGAGFHPAAATMLPIDSKAKRVLEEGQSVALVVENASATTGFIAALNLRILAQVRGT